MRASRIALIALRKLPALSSCAAFGCMHMQA